MSGKFWSRERVTYTPLRERPIPVTPEEDEAWSERVDVPHKEPTRMLPQSAIRIARECDRIKATLIEKNLAYGNSALDPVRLFSKADPVEQLMVRIDDKLSRIQRGGEYPGDDTLLDLIGYMVLLRLAIREPA